MLSWRPFHPGQLKPTTLPLRRLAPDSCSVGLSPTLSLPLSPALSPAPHSPSLSPLRRHKLPTPHLALWPTEVHVVVRGKVCEKGCYFLGIKTPLVATCKNKVCISNICHYLHFWKHTDFQNKDIQSPKYSVVLHLDHCIPVRGGGGGGAAYFFSPLCSRVITESPYTPQIKEPQTYLSWKHTENYPKAYT